MADGKPTDADWAEARSLWLAPWSRGAVRAIAEALARRGPARPQEHEWEQDSDFSDEPHCQICGGDGPLNEYGCCGDGSGSCHDAGACLDDDCKIEHCIECGRHVLGESCPVCGS